MDNYSDPNLRGLEDETENWVGAEYNDPGIEIYRGNPYIEALPPDLLDSEKEVVKRLRYLPPYNPDDRLLPKRTRFHLIYNSNQFFRPLTIHLSLERDISIMIRSGYLGRNPIHKYYLKQVDRPIDEVEGEDDDKNIHPLRSTATGFYMVGISGVGKSTAIWMILNSLYPQVIRHKFYKGKLV